jgi:hypothetical protein
MDGDFFCRSPMRVKKAHHEKTEYQGLVTQQVCQSPSPQISTPDCTEDPAVNAAGMGKSP